MKLSEFIVLNRLPRSVLLSLPALANWITCAIISLCIQIYKQRHIEPRIFHSLLQCTGGLIQITIYDYDFGERTKYKELRVLSFSNLIVRTFSRISKP